MCQVVTCTTEKNKARGTEMDRGELLLFYIVGGGVSGNATVTLGRGPKEVSKKPSRFWGEGHSTPPGNSSCKGPEEGGSQPASGSAGS